MRQLSCLKTEINICFATRYSPEIYRIQQPSVSRKQQRVILMRKQWTLPPLHPSLYEISPLYRTSIKAILPLLPELTPWLSIC